MNIDRRHRIGPVGRIRRTVKIGLTFVFLVLLLSCYFLNGRVTGQPNGEASRSVPEVSPLSLSNQAQPGTQPATETDGCVACHREMGDELEAPVAAMDEHDIHRQRGFSCADCHGGDPTEDDPESAMDPRRGFVGKPSSGDVPGFCGKCHSHAEFMKRYNPSIRVDQEAEYSTSVHGRRLAGGDENVATCVSCHGSHGIRAVSDPGGPVYPTTVAQTCGKCHGDAETMEPYSIPHDQPEKYNASVHADALMKGHDLSAPTCNDCHGNHGATPPGVTSVANVCGSCHVRQADLFRKSPHKEAYDAMDMAECLVCHSNHEILRPTDELLGVGEQALCIVCHSEGDAGYRAAQEMRQMIDRLSGRLQAAEALVQRAARAGMEVSRTQFELNDAHDKLINARVVIHGFAPSELEKVVNSGLEVTAKSHQEGEEALAELQVRRKGLAASLIVIFLAVAAVYLKIKQIESSERGREE